MKLATVIAAALALTGVASAAKAQNFLNTDISALANQWARSSNVQMTSLTNGIVASNMRNPAVIAAYRANPRGMTFQQFALAYGANAGFTREGMARLRASEANNRAREQAALADYRAGQQNFANAVAARNASASAWNQEIGRAIVGQQTYYGPQGPISLSYMPNATPWTQGSYTYRPTGNGGWVASGSGGNYYLPYR